jgi:tRNA (guanine-N7-)-methyltransferase
MSRALKYDFAGPDRRVAPEDLAGDGLAKLFARDLPAPPRLTVDLGFGRGELLLELAAADPTGAYLGVEYSFKRVLKLARRLARTELRNVRLVRATAEAVVGDRLRDRCVSAFWINFPDPWPKKRHHRRRLLQPGFVAQLARRLEPGGVLQVATDHAGYAEAIAEVLAGEPLLENVHAPQPWRDEPPPRCATAYELEWRAQGRACHYFAWRRVRETTLA